MTLDANAIAKIIDDVNNKKLDKILSRTFRRGIIATPKGQYADVYIEGNTTATQGIPILGDYSPVVGDKVLVLSIGDSGSNLIILGPIYSSLPTLNTVATATTILPTSRDYFVTALASAATVGSPGAVSNGTKLMLRIKDNGTARALTWNAIWRGVGTALPSTTVANKVLYIGAVYNSQDSKWDVLAVSQQ